MLRSKFTLENGNYGLFLPVSGWLAGQDSYFHTAPVSSAQQKNPYT